MFNKDKKNKENATKAQETLKHEAKEQENAMQELGDDVLNTISGAGDPFASHPRVSTKGIDSSLRNKG